MCEAIYRVLLNAILWIFQNQAEAFVASETRRSRIGCGRVSHLEPIHFSSLGFDRSRKHGKDGSRLPRRLDHSGGSGPTDDSSGGDSLETLSELLAGLLKTTTKADGYPTNDKSSCNEERRRALLTTRLSHTHDVNIHRTFVQNSTLAHAGKGLFVRHDCRKGTLLTCYPGDALVDLSTQDGTDAASDIDETEQRITWGSHTKTVQGDETTSTIGWALRQEYMLRAVCDDWGIVAIPELGAKDSSYCGHYANDGASPPPTCERELAAYVIESANMANAVHQPCEGCHMVTVATRDLRAGEEVFVTYGPDYWRSQASFVASDQYWEEDGHDEYDYEIYDEDFEQSDEFGHDCDDEDASADMEPIWSEAKSLSEASSEASSRGKGFG